MVSVMPGLSVQVWNIWLLSIRAKILIDKIAERSCCWILVKDDKDRISARCFAYVQHV